MNSKRLMPLAIGLLVFGQAGQAEWTPAKRLTWTSGNSEWPVIAVGPSGNPHVVWSEWVLGHEIYYKNSADGGATWTPAKRLTWSSDLSGLPAIAVDSSGNLHIVWSRSISSANTEIYYKKSTDAGVTWTTAKRLTWTSFYSSNPALAVDPSSHLHIVWSEQDWSGKTEIYYKTSTDSGATWTTAMRLTWTPDRSTDPDMVIDPTGALHLTWIEALGAWPYNEELYYKRSLDGGANWTTGKRLTWSPGSSNSPVIAASVSGNPSVAWSEETSGSYDLEIFYRQSTDGGANWAARRRVTWSSTVSSYSALSVDASGNPHVFWEEDLDWGEIFYKKSSDAGVTWTKKNISWSSRDSYYPEVAMDSSGYLHVVWQESMPGSFEIFYRKGK